jgi:hypothetical protein
VSARETPLGTAAVTDDDAGRRASTIAWVVAAVVGISGFVILTALLAMKQTIPFDEPLMALAKPYAVDKFAWNVLSESANFPLVAIGLGIVAMLFLAHRRRDAIAVFFVLAAATAGSEGVKQLVQRPRPPGSSTSRSLAAADRSGSVAYRGDRLLKGDFSYPTSSSMCGRRSRRAAP